MNIDNNGINSNIPENNIKLEIDKEKLKMQNNNIKLEADKSKLGLVKTENPTFISNTSQQPIVNSNVINNETRIETPTFISENGMVEVKHSKREYKTLDINGGVETVYFYACPTCGALKEIRGKEINSVSERGIESYCNCGNKFFALKPGSEDFKAPSLMDTFGDFIQKDTNPETQNMLDTKDIDNVLKTINDSFGINIPKESLNKLPVGVKKILRDIFN